MNEFYWLVLLIGIGAAIAIYFGVKNNKREKPASAGVAPSKTYFTVNPVYLAAAEKIVAQLAALDASGEYKRHQALAMLKKLFPEAPERELSKAIEGAVEATL